MTEEKGLPVDALTEIQNGETAAKKELAPSSHKGDSPGKYSGHAFLFFSYLKQI